MTNYNEAVAEARQLVKRSEEDQWRLAELTWEQVEAGKSRAQWARDIGVSSDHTERLFIVWSKFSAARERYSFADAYAMAARGVGDPVEARQKAEDLRAVGVMRNLPPERKAEVARELLTEPEVQAAVEEHIADSPAAVARVNQEAERRRPAPPRHEPKRNALSAAASLTAFAAWVAEGERVVSEVVSDVMDGQADPALLAEPNRNLAVLLARLQSAAGTGKNFDAALADILNGEH